MGKTHYGKEPSIWPPPNPFPKGIRRVKNSLVRPPKIEDFDQQFMGSFLGSSVQTVFYRNDLREVHTVIERGFPKMGEIRHEGDRLIHGLKWPSGEDRSALTNAHFRKGIRREEEKGTSRRREEKNPLLVESCTNSAVLNDRSN